MLIRFSGHSQLVQHPLHLLIDLTGSRATMLFILDHAGIAFRGADGLIALTPIKGQRSLFTPAVERWLVIGNLQQRFSRLVLEDETNKETR